MARLSELICPGMSVLLDFQHGLGDCISFIPVVAALRKHYPDVSFCVRYNPTCNNYLGGATDSNDKFDLVFPLGFPMAEGSGRTKPELCCDTELGLDYALVHEYDCHLPCADNPYVLCTFNAAKAYGKVECTPEQKQIVWNEIVTEGLIPMEVYYEGYWGETPSRAEPYMTRHMRDFGPSLQLMVAQLRNCRACITVVTGVFHVALAVIPDRTLLLEKDHRLADYAKLVPCSTLRLDKPLEGRIREWLQLIR